MAPADFDYVATRNKIIEAAFRICGVLELSNSLNANQIQQGVEALQLLVKSWNNEHLFLWAYNLGSFPTIIGQGLYTNSVLDPAIIGLDQAWVVDGNDDIPIEVITWSRYQNIKSKEAETGRPLAVAFKPTPEPTIYVWPSPDAAYTIKTLTISALEDMDSASGHGDIPVRFQRALKYGLADDLFDEYPGPMNEREFVKDKAAELFAKARRSDMPRETTSEVEGFFSCD